MIERTRQRSGAAHAVPLVAQAAGGEAERKARIDLVRRRAVGVVGEARLAVRRRKPPVRVKARRAGLSARTQRPLLRATFVEKRIRQARDVEIALPAGLAALVV